MASGLEVEAHGSSALQLTSRSAARQRSGADSEAKTRWAVLLLLKRHGYTAQGTWLLLEL